MGASRKRADDGDVKEGGRMKGTSRKGADERDIKEGGRMKGTSRKGVVEEEGCGRRRCRYRRS